MVRIEQKGIKRLLDYLTDLYFEDPERYPFNLWFGDDMEPNAFTLYDLIYRQLNKKLSSLDLYLEKADVQFGENTDFEINDTALKKLTEKFNAKLNTPIGKNDVEALFGEINEVLEIKDVAKFFAIQIERVVLITFEFENFDKYVSF